MEELSIEMPIDEDGFVLLQCNLCGEYFKMKAKDIEAEENISIWCPYCGLKGDNYIPEEVKEIAIKKAINEMNNMIYSSFKDLETSTRKNKSCRIKSGKKPKEEEIQPIKAKINKLEDKEYKCCKKKVKIKPLLIETGSYCPFCGGRYDE